MKQGTGVRGLVIRMVILVIVAAMPITGFGEVPQQVNYQGNLTDADGNSLSGNYGMSFAIYDVSTNGTAMWFEFQTVSVIDGIYNVQIGQDPIGNPFPDNLFDGPRWLGVTVDADPEMIPRQPLTSTPYAMKAGDADTLEGMSSGDLDQSSHVGDNSNPHTVTAAQVGAATAADVSAHAAITDAHHTKTTSFADLLDVATDGQLPSAIARDSEILWSNLPDIPAGFADGVDDVGGISSEVDPQVGVNTLNYVPKWNGVALVTGAIFDNGSVGIGTASPSAKLDVEVTSSGGAATIGHVGNSATGDFAIALGIGTEAIGQYSTAMGNGTNATGFDSTAMGYGTTASGSESTAIGYLTTASGFNSTAMGSQTTASGDYSTAMGGSTIASNRFSTATGYLTRANGQRSTAMGTHIIAQGNYSFGIGLEDDNFTTITQDSTMAIMGGHVGIGTTTPGATLHVIGSGSDLGLRGEHSNGNHGILGGMLTGVYAESIAVGVHALSSGSCAISAENTGSGNLFEGHAGGIVVFRVANDGSTTMRGNLLLESASTGNPVLELGEGLDYAEGFDVSTRDRIDAGSVLVIDERNPGKLALSSKPYDTKVAGIVAGANGLGSGVRLGAGRFDFDVALAGRVYCNVDATDSGVQAGDLLTTAAIPGHAMKAADETLSHGSILGKAMESLGKGRKGKILVLVTLQ